MFNDHKLVRRHSAAQATIMVHHLPIIETSNNLIILSTMPLIIYQPLLVNYGRLFATHLIYHYPLDTTLYTSGRGVIFNYAVYSIPIRNYSGQ